MPRVQFGRGSGPDWNPQTVLRQSHQRPSTECLRGGPDLRSVCPVGWTRARIIELEPRAKSAFALRVRRLGKLPNSAPKLFESWTPFCHYIHPAPSMRANPTFPLGHAKQSVDLVNDLKNIIQPVGVLGLSKEKTFLEEFVYTPGREMSALIRGQLSASVTGDGRFPGREGRNNGRTCRWTSQLRLSSIRSS